MYVMFKIQGMCLKLGFVVLCIRYLVTAFDAG